MIDLPIDPPDVKFKKIPAVKKMQLIAQLQLGRPIETILEEYGDVDESGYYRPVQKRDLDRLYNRFVRKGGSQEEIYNIMDVLR